MAQRLTKRIVDAAEPKPGKERWITDSDVPGFALRITAAGAKLYVVRYRYAGKLQKIPLGRHGQITVELARQKARDVFAALAEGKDPAATHNNGPTIADLRERYEQEHSKLHKKARSQESERISWDKHIIPRLGSIYVRDLTRDDVVLMHTSSKKRYAMNRALALLSHAMNMAELWKWREEGTNPCRLVKRYKEEERERILNPDELRTLLKELDRTERERLEGLVVVNLVRMILMTGCRQSEIRTARWEWIDWNRHVLALPDSKGGRKDVDLAPPAIELLQRMRASDRGEWIIPGRVRGQHLVNPTKPWKAICDRAGLGRLRLHDLRHTYGTMAALEGLSLREIADLLGHRSTVSTMRYVNAANWKKKDNAAAVAKIFIA